MNKKVIGTICGVVIVSSVLSISKCDYFNNVKALIGQAGQLSDKCHVDHLVIHQ